MVKGVEELSFCGPIDLVFHLSDNTFLDSILSQEKINIRFISLESTISYYIIKI